MKRQSEMDREKKKMRGEEKTGKRREERGEEKKNGEGRGKEGCRGGEDRRGEEIE